jgi:hypothetical protein
VHLISRIDVVSVSFLYQVHSAETYLYQVSDILHSVHIGALVTLTHYDSARDAILT